MRQVKDKDKSFKIAESCPVKNEKKNVLSIQRYTVPERTYIVIGSRHKNLKIITQFSRRYVVNFNRCISFAIYHLDLFKSIEIILKQNIFCFLFKHSIVAKCISFI